MLISADKPMTEVEWLTAYTIETEEFRDMDFGGIGLDQAYLLSSQWETDIYSILAASLIREAVSEKKQDDRSDENEKLADLSYEEYRH